jgi:midasin (ATPase involved in ribosome maturation)
MAIDFKNFLECAPHVMNVGKPILIRGRHGVGKSEVVYQIAKDLDLPVVERRASQMTEGDLLGMPSPEMVEINGEEASHFRPFSWFIQACTEPVVLFLDEIDRATTEVRQGIFELTDSRKLAGWVLHPGTRVVAAVNGGIHGDQYQVNEMDPAELDRYTVFDVEPSVEDWLDWAKENVSGVVWDFVNQNRNHLEHTDDFEPNKVYPSRRSWKRLNDCLAHAKLLEEATPTLFNLSCGFVGFEAAVTFNDFIANYERQVTVEDVVDNGHVEKTKDFDINQHNALVEKMEAVDLFSENKLSGEQITNLANYFVTLPSEVCMKLWTVMGQGNVDNTTAFHQAVATDGTRVSSHLVEILTGNSSKE